MNIYFATRWGHDESPDGPNGEDTNFIVRARDRDEAAAVVDQFLMHSLHHERVDSRCNTLHELGHYIGPSTEPSIIHGPWYAHAFLDGRHYRSWIREIHTDWEWKDVDELYQQTTEI